VNSLNAELQTSRVVRGGALTSEEVARDWELRPPLLGEFLTDVRNELGSAVCHDQGILHRD
jgi:hypothetical protein